jgi:Sulfotransferase family
MISVIQPLYHLREGPIQDSDDRIISIYNEMYDAYFEERGLIPEGRLCDVSYEELERQPVAAVRSVYESLGISAFENIRPRLERYLGSPAIARTSTMSCPNHCASASSKRGTGASRNGGTIVDRTKCVTGTRTTDTQCSARSVSGISRESGMISTSPLVFRQNGTTADSSSPSVLPDGTSTAGWDEDSASRGTADFAFAGFDAVGRAPFSGTIFSGRAFLKLFK